MTEPLLSLRGVTKRYRVRRGLFGAKRTLTALSELSLDVAEGETLGLVGESGCGKSTAVRIMLGLEPPDEGEVRIAGSAIAAVKRRALSRMVQPVFQDPYYALNPSRSVTETVLQPLKVHGLKGDLRAEVRRMLDLVGFPARLGEAYPAQLSGGQRQRVAIARALVLKPRLLICDEPTSALDVSVQAQVINLLLDLRRELGLTMIFVSHNLAVVEHISDRVTVMYLGEIVEEAETDRLFRQPAHPYTQMLLSSTLAPTPGAGLPSFTRQATVADAFAERKGCAFAPRCERAQDLCHATAPEAQRRQASFVRCHYPSAAVGS